MSLKSIFFPLRAALLHRLQTFLPPGAAFSSRIFCPLFSSSPVLRACFFLKSPRLVSVSVPIDDVFGVSADYLQVRSRSTIHDPQPTAQNRTPSSRLDLLQLDERDLVKSRTNLPKQTLGLSTYTRFDSWAATRVRLDSDLYTNQDLN